MKDRLLTMGEAAKLSQDGWTRRHTARVLRAANDQAGGTILQTTSGGHLRILMSALRQLFPEWFETPATVDDRLLRLEMSIEGLADEVRAMRVQLRGISKTNGTSRT